MTHSVLRNTRSIGAVIGDASEHTRDSGLTKQFQKTYATHSKKSLNPLNSLAQSPRSTTLNRGFSASTFEAAIGGGL